MKLTAPKYLILEVSNEILAELPKVDQELIATWIIEAERRRQEERLFPRVTCDS